jgi:nucleotide-binding universal stress UspA family protein
MNDEEKMILACIDGSRLSNAVCDYAAWLAQRVEMPLKLLHTIDHHHETAASVDLSGNIGVDSRDHLLVEIADAEHALSKPRIRQGKAILQTAKARVIEDGYAHPITCLQHGSLIESLQELEARLRVLVIGARGVVHEGQAHTIGNKLEAIIRSLHGHILVAYTEFKAPQRVMIAYDGEESADRAITMIAGSPFLGGLSCHLVCVGKRDGDALLAAAQTRLQGSGWQEIITSNLQGKAELALCDYQSQHDIDLTVMGAFGHSRLHELLHGSVTAKMLLNTRTPLLILR